MEMKILAQQLGISHQMANRLKRQGMDCSSLDAAKAWRKANIDPFRSKTGRIGGGNTGKKYQSAKVNETALEADRVYSGVERKILEETLSSILPNLYFERVDWLAAALKEVGVTVTGAQVVEIQDTLFSTYLEEIWFGKLKIETDGDYMLPPLFEMRIDSKERKSRIAELDQLLSEDTAAE